MGFAIYFIIGIIMFTFTSIRMAIKDPVSMKTNIRNWIWWAATIMCVIIWPAIVAWAIYDAFQEVV